MSAALLTVGLVLAPTAACKPGADGGGAAPSLAVEGRGGGSGALAPPLPRASDPSSGGPASGPCHQADLERKAAQSLARELKLPDRFRELPPPIPPHFNPVGEVTHLNAVARRPPMARAKNVRSLRAITRARLRYQPSHASEEVGTLTRGTRIPPRGFVHRRGCSRGWVSLGPTTYVCLNKFRPDSRGPATRDVPRVPAGRVTPGVYGYIRSGGSPAFNSRSDATNKLVTRSLPGGFFIRFGRFTRIAGRNFWKTTKGLYVPIDRIARHIPSKYHGVHLAERGLTLPLGIVRIKGRGARVYRKPGAGRVVDRLARYAPVRLLGIAKARTRFRRRTKFYRIGPCRWVAARAIRRAWPVAAPPGVRQGERWVDINLGQQTLVAYEGQTPVFATLISSGKDKYPTRHGVFRVYWKVSELDMSSEMGATEEYLAESVPWSMFFWKGQAVHGTYWHDDFGRQKSHGCVNLSPRDARWLFDWSGPRLPAGWAYSWHGEKYPGPVIQVRRRHGSNPRVLGYARRFAGDGGLARRDRDYQARVKQATLAILREKQPVRPAAPRKKTRRKRPARTGGFKPIKQPVPPPPSRRRR